VLSRKTGESIMIGEAIEVVILSVDGDSVRVGIKAPKEVEIYREEIYKAIKQSNQEAVQSRYTTKDLSDWFGDKS
jgi:carbon storage regulator